MIGLMHRTMYPGGIALINSDVIKSKPEKIRIIDLDQTSFQNLFEAIICSQSFAFTR